MQNKINNAISLLEDLRDTLYKYNKAEIHEQLQIMLYIIKK